MKRILKGLGLAGMIVLAFGAVAVTTALAATVNKTAIQNGMELGECTFVNVGDKCQIKYTVNGEGAGWKVSGNYFEGAKAAERYKKTVGCTVGKILKDKESCIDVIEMIKKEAGTENKWCVTWSDQDEGLQNVPLCVKLKM